METTRLQVLYWQSQTIHDKMFSLESHIHKLKRQGKNPLKTYERYFELLNELRNIKAEILLFESA